MAILHITNGDSAAEGLRASGLIEADASVLPWRDVLHDGPVPDYTDRAAFADVRSAFLADRQWTTLTEARSVFTIRDDTLDRHVGDIVLWFEPDMYDQLQLIQVMSRIAELSDGGIRNRRRISIVPADRMLGSLSPDEFPPLFAKRREVTEHDGARATRAWRAFIASTPESLQDVIRDELSAWPAGTRYANAPNQRLPFLGTGLQRLLAEYPDAKSGLSQSERQICQSLSKGPINLGQLYVQAHHNVETWPWLGDWSFAWYVERLSQGVEPMLRLKNDQAQAFPSLSPPTPDVWKHTVELTPFGKEVLSRTLNTIDVNGIDRWIGGTHLTTGNCWYQTEGLLAKFPVPYTM